MPGKTSTKDIQKTTVTFPPSVLKRLREHVAPRQRSAFIAEAVEDKLALEEQLDALEKAAGTWSDQDHPDLHTDQDIDRWLSNLRHSWDGHLRDLRVPRHGKS